MVQNLRAYFILYVITIKCIKCMQDRIESSCMLRSGHFYSWVQGRRIISHNQKKFYTPS